MSNCVSGVNILGTIEGNCSTLTEVATCVTEFDEPAHHQPAQTITGIIIGGTIGVGGVVSTMKVLVAGVGSMFPAVSTERMRTV